jgi:hypothetical protein
VLVILLTGGTKQRQQRDITAAREHWVDISGDGRQNGNWMLGRRLK